MDTQRANKQLRRRAERQCQPPARQALLSVRQLRVRWKLRIRGR
jgi:hypothetical protein